MLWINILLLTLTVISAKEEETNEVSSPPKINLDPNLRRALLKALTELENEDNDKQSRSQSTEDNFIEKASASALSIFASTTPHIITSTTTPTSRPIVVIQKSNGLQHKPIAFNGLQRYNNEEIITSASNSFTSSDKFPTKNPNLVSDQIKIAPKLPRTQKIENTTAVSTTSTEENQAKVEDVQFFPAPLVAAFTVHQDERGQPKSVEPIYRTPKPQLSTTERIQEEQFRTQIALQEKQKALEAEILRLKHEQQQQNYLIRQQQILHQQHLQLQKQKLFEEQNRLIQQQKTTTQRNEFGRIVTGKENLIAFQPSISFNGNQPSSGFLPLNGQQLPVKNAIDFSSPLSSNFNYEQFNYLSQQQPPILSSVANFNSHPQVNLAAPHHHRVFRQEIGTGNFGNFGTNFNNRNNLYQQQQNFNDLRNGNSNRFFRSNAESSLSFNSNQQPFNQQLNNLIYNSGVIRGKPQEVDIISKVLSLNHHLGDNRFSASTINEQRVKALTNPKS